MFNKLKQFIATSLTLVMLFIPTANVFASSNIEVTKSTNYEINADELLDEAENIASTLSEEDLTSEVLKENFENMSEEARQIFLNEIKYDEELLNFHKENIDPSCTLEKPRRSKRSAGTLTLVRTGLERIGLPRAVRYALTQWAGSLLAALADGPLPIGDAVALGDTVVTAIIVGMYWDDIKNDTDEIIDVFKDAFGKNARTVTKALDKIFAKSDKPTGSKVRDVQKRLKKEGFRKTRQTGSHERWEKGSRQVTVPNHGGNKDIPTGTLRNIWKQAGWL